MGKLSIEALLATYPRTRPPLSEAHKKIFVDEYILNRCAGGLLYGAIRRLESWEHRQVAKLRDPQKSVLEIGSGSLNHVPYEPNTEAYDCIEPFSQLFQGSPYLGKIRNVYSDIAHIREDASYERIISIGVLEHLVNLPETVARSGLLLTSDGVFQGSIPSEGGFLWGLSWRLTTGVAYRLRTGLDYKTVMRHEHINTAEEILEVTKYFFENVRIARFPLASIHLSFYTYLEATNSRHKRCNTFMRSSKSLAESHPDLQTPRPARQ